MAGLGRKTRSIEEQMAKLKEKDEAKEEFERELSFQSDQHTAKKAIGGGTKTLAERLSQSLRDPLRSKDYLGTVDKGEITIDCHHHSKIIRFKNRKGYLSKDAMGSLTELIQLSDTNWYEKFSILKGGEEGFCAGLLPAQGPHQIGLHADLDAKCLQYRLGWLIARSKRRRMAILDGPCLGAGATMALSHWSPDEAEAFKAQTLGANTQETTSEKSQQKDGKHLRIATGRLQLSFQNAHFLGAFPGVGASFYLTRLRGHVGMYLALTGARIGVEDALFCGAASHYVQTHRIDKLQKALTDSDVNSTDAQITAIVNDFAVSPGDRELMKHSVADPPLSSAAGVGAGASYWQRFSMQGVAEPAHLMAQFDNINRCFGQTSIEAILEALTDLDTPWARQSLERLQMMSPTARKITFALLRRGASCSLEECVRTEWRLAHRSWPDLAEGVRAFEKDKDGRPVWGTCLANEEVQALFQPIDLAHLTPLLLTQDHLKQAAAAKAPATAASKFDRKF